jgi:hypothetical protein
MKDQSNLALAYGLVLRFAGVSIYASIWAVCCFAAGFAAATSMHASDSWSACVGSFTAGCGFRYILSRRMEEIVKHWRLLRERRTTRLLVAGVERHSATMIVRGWTDNGPGRGA